MPPISSQSGAVTLHPNSEQLNGVRVPEYSLAQQKYIIFKRQRMRAARDARDMPDYRFDDMKFLENWDKNDRADNSYIKPRNNKADTEINMGIVRDKDNTLLALALKYDYEPTAQVFDDNDDMLQDLAESAEDLVRKSLHMEDDNEKVKSIYRGMLTYGLQVVEEVYLERWRMDKVLVGVIGAKGNSWTEKLVKIYDGCIQRPWDLRKCYFGNKNTEYMNGPLGQPYFFTVEYLSYDETKAIYGEWDMWDCVPNILKMSAEVQNASTWSAGWALQPLNQYQCEIIKYYDPIANEFAIGINGIDLLPIQEKEMVDINGGKKTYISGFPLTAISPSGAIPFATYNPEPINGFIYGKSTPSKTRVIADVEDMTVKLMILGMKQMRRPPKGSRSNRIFSSDIFLPGQITNDVREGELFDILPQQPGVQPAEFSFYETMKKGRDEISTTRGFSGTGSDMGTATQAIQDKEQQMDKVALMLDGITRGRQQMYWLRTYNIFANWTKIIDKEIDSDKKEVRDLYNSYTIPKIIDGHKNAHKKIHFTTNKIPGKTSLDQSTYVHQQEVDANKISNTEVRIAYLNPEILKQMKLTWYYSVTPVARNNDSLGQMMFAKAISDAIAFFGPQSLNVTTLKRKYAIKYNQEFDTFFLDENALSTLQAQQTVTNAQPSIANVAQKSIPKLGAVMK